MNNRLGRDQVRSPFGLTAWLEETRVVLPLKGVECRFGVCGELLRVELDQIFHQNNPQPLDCTYTFPLPSGAAVYRCEMHVNGRVIKAKVEEEGKARRMVKEKKKAGHRTMLVEQERDNVFTLSLGNLQSGDVVVVRLAYFQTLTRLEDWASFHIPFCPGVRYIPGKPLLRSPSGRGTADDTDQVPDASRISPPRMDALHPDAAYLSVSGTVEGVAGQIGQISSPTHPLVVRDGENIFHIDLATNGALPDRDLVVRWVESVSGKFEATGWTWVGEGERYALVRLQSGSERGAAPENGAGQDIYFLLDRSTSMRGLKWKRTVEAFHQFVKGLDKEDRVWATLFESGYQDLAEKPMSAEVALADEGLQALESLGVTGGTEIFPALQHVVKAVEQHSQDRRAMVVLITDGQVGNEAQVLEFLKLRPDLMVHTVGIDTAVNDAFLKGMADQQHGTCHLLTPQDDIVGAVSRLRGRLRPPAWTQIEAVNGWEMPSARSAQLHVGDCLYLSLKGPAEAAEVHLKGFQAGGHLREVRVPLIHREEPALALLWVKQHMTHCLFQKKRHEAIALSKRHNLVCQGTSFIAWDEAEKVAVSQTELYQPAMELASPRHFGDRLLCSMPVPDRRMEIRGRSFHGRSSQSAAKNPIEPLEIFLAKPLPELRKEEAYWRKLMREHPERFLPFDEQRYDKVLRWVTLASDEWQGRWRFLKWILDKLAKCPVNAMDRRQGWVDKLEQSLSGEWRNIMMNVQEGGGVPEVPGGRD